MLESKNNTLEIRAKLFVDPLVSSVNQRPRGYHPSIDEGHVQASEGGDRGFHNLAIVFILEVMHNNSSIIEAVGGRGGGGAIGKQVQYYLVCTKIVKTTD